MIEINHVDKWYGPTQVLKDCTTAVAKGEVVVVCGPSGSGKSTLIKCVNGLEPFQNGTIRVDGISLGDRKTNLPRLRARIGMVFQHFELFPHLTVMRNLTLPQVKVLRRSPQEARDKLEPGGCSGPGYLACWNRYWAYTKTDEFKARLGAGVLFPKRLGYASEFASLAIELLTNSYMNAESIRIDAGIRMQPT